MSSKGFDAAALSDIVKAHDALPGRLIQILHDVQARFGHVPEDAARQLANELNISRADVHGVVSFYHDFRTEPTGKHIVRICQAEACQAMGSRALTEHARGALGVDLDGTADDVTLLPVYCLGNCACAPAVMIGERTYGRVTSERFDELIGGLEDGLRGDD
ncbi:MAG: formate dehydrogenase subunit gamma [Woeseiaceae bacterium]|nr:formate dehydrogenase subunit gamma [Woeseiaceae bacterium]